MFGIDIIDATLLPAMFVALTAGLLSFLSPCVLPIVPPYLAYMGGISMSDMSGEIAARRKVLLSALFFVHVLFFFLHRPSIRVAQKHGKGSRFSGGILGSTCQNLRILLFGNVLPRLLQKDRMFHVL